MVDDVGRIINPETLHGQVIGAAVQGLGQVPHHLYVEGPYAEMRLQPAA